MYHGEKLIKAKIMQEQIKSELDHINDDESITRNHLERPFSQEPPETCHQPEVIIDDGSMINTNLLYV